MSIGRVVVADDESVIRLDLTEMLTAAGYEVVGQASDGEKALHLIEQLRPDVAVLDIKMPLVDGIEVARLVRIDTPVVLLTAFGQKDMILSASEAGAMGYVLKPFNESEIVAAIEIARSRHAEWSALKESLEVRKILDRAKGLLQSKLDLTESDSFRWIQKAAMDRRLSVKEVALSVIEEIGK